MKEVTYTCNRCNQEIKDTGSRIIANYFDVATDEQLKYITVPTDDVHFCMKCTSAIMKEVKKEVVE